MSKRFSNLASIIAVAIASPVTLAIGVAIYEAATPAEASFVRAVMESVGEGEAAQVNASREADAHYQYRMSQALEEAKRMSVAYNNLYNAAGNALQRATNLEAELIKRQARDIDDTHWVRKFGTNLADAGCMLSMVSPEYEFDGACQVTETLRRDMVGQYQKILPDARPRFVEDFLSEFPHPSEFLHAELERLDSEFGQGAEE